MSHILNSSLTSATSPKVFVVDDDAAFRRLADTILTSVKLTVETFDSSRSFIERPVYDGPGCLVLDFCMPGTNGLELLRTLRARGYSLPVVFITGQADVPLAVEVMKLGAFEFLQKPCTANDLIRAVQGGIRRSEATWADQSQRAAGQRRLDLLSKREREVAELLSTGMGTKAVAKQLELSPKTVEFHRTRLYRKLDVTNAVELVRALQGAGGQASPQALAV
ncbi:MAG: response regulator [Pirellulales bacterium]